MLIIDAPAKINLSLDILGKRPDGYHELETVMHTVPLCDRITLTEQARVEVLCSHPGVPDGVGNLAYQAVELLKNRYAIQAGVRIVIDKHIPVAAGLAGGSTDAAAVLKGLNRLWKLGMTDEQLLACGAQLGSDVPFCLTGGCALGRGRGEQLHTLTLLPDCCVVLAKPDIFVSTAWAYGQVNPELLPYPNCSAEVMNGLATMDLQHIVRHMGNAMERVTVVAHPVLATIKATMVGNGALGALMSGSGPTLFAIADGVVTARRIADKVRAFTSEVFIVSMAENRLLCE